MARLRVYLLTYRRPQLLRRALASLRAQTLTDWVCELHNDAPDDPFPGQLLAEIGDARITLHQHDHNWGAVASFNHVFAGGPERYASLLEDDNWWDPHFLATTLATIEARPTASLVWANMRIWREEPDGNWSDTGRTIWKSAGNEAPVRSFRWPEAMQIFDGLHSNGAMIFRPCTFLPRSVPTNTPFAIIEPLRERAAQGELLLLTSPLAHFAQTLATTRSSNRAHWLQCQLLLSCSFLAAVTVDDTSLAQIWTRLRHMTPRGTNLLFLTAISLRQPNLVKPARATDWLFFLLSFIRRLPTNLRGLRFRREQPELQGWLRLHTSLETLRPTQLLLDKHADT